MTKIDKEKICKLFDEYTSNYDNNDGKIYLKIIHTKNVADNCEKIAQSIDNFSEDDIKLAWLIGMMHDIGRFEQIKRYGTFKDEDSINHAEFGVQLLFDENLLENFVDLDDASKEIVRLAILNHNKLQIDDDISDRQKDFAKIIRDADKLDIFRVCALDPEIDVYGGSKEEIEASEISKDVYDLAMKKKCIPYTMRYTLANDIVCHLALIWDLNYKVSVEIAKEQGYYKQMQDFNFKNKQTIEYYKDILKIL